MIEMLALNASIFSVGHTKCSILNLRLFRALRVKVLTSDITSKNPVVEAIVSGTAPQPARLAAARGLLPLPQSDLLEVLVALAGSEDQEIAEAATESLQTEDADGLLIAAESDE